MQVQLSYQAKDKAEFIELVTMFGERVSASVQPSKKGPNETEFNRITNQRLKLSSEESKRVEAGEATRETIAEERLLAYAPSASSDDFESMRSVADIQAEELPGDDKEEF